MPFSLTSLPTLLKLAEKKAPGGIFLSLIGVSARKPLSFVKEQHRGFRHF